MKRLAIETAAAFLAFLVFPACIYQDARTGCTEVKVVYDIDATACSGAVAPSLDYHREGVGGTTSNAAKQDGKIEPKTDLKLPLMAP